MFSVPKDCLHLSLLLFINQDQDWLNIASFREWFKMVLFEQFDNKIVKYCLCKAVHLGVCLACLVLGILVVLCWFAGSTAEWL